MLIRTVTFILLLQAAAGCSKSQKKADPNDDKPAPVVTTFKNPLLSSGPDPWVIQKDGFYYYMNTQGNRISIYKTKTLSQLDRAEIKVVYNAPASGADSKNIWAPELHFLNSKWYIYYTAGSSGDLSTQRMFVLENSDADPTKGTWVVKGQIKDNAADFFAIDATVFSKDSKNYIIWSGHISATDNTQRLYISTLADEPWKMASPRAQISVPQYDWEKIGTPDVNEGPEILMNKKGNVFLIFSASGCWTDDYSLGMVSLKENGDPMKPADWTKSAQPVFTKKPENGAYGPGHNGFFKSPDGTEDWIIYHANPRAGLACSNDRSPRMQKFSWNTDGTPNFGEPVMIDAVLLKPSGE
ncbi:MAG TPA: glycoside hydrolase family 43 protein [Pedobacter sp.]|uniref:glycoside hydrolase family 43 protein n=1 Tax=Pedobacter sp. TaxID=1411316 RepID=UPI002B7D7AA4|nr:glycoside hydrolase family 43 protein [Pedobacter sp.]HMI05829.1 glycoside hydrolase family 43 protein [Pedobacter sp.]